ncbi:response regulator transcription factor [Alsobacter sp. SYSU M60028]|uniref:Response regulator transcription factor n=1 Tax=Alsobacter ponti TaxID=2962936 RepID=A0ABT1LDW7_9HYPH|nr:response regulator transcription factor [Alsobacter ponti]MCP8939689.1 response regulator transcription factor [Alsobacter ponti]
MRILVVEDDAMVAGGLVEALQRAGFGVDHALEPETAEAAARETAYDAALVDINLPRFDGLELIRRFRRAGLTFPILILSAREGLEDRVAGLDIGADDYLTKPFAIPELLARLRALLRRSHSASQATLSIGGLRIDLTRRLAQAEGVFLELTRREWDLLECLVLAAPKVLSKRVIAERLGAWDNEITPNAIEIYVSRLRGKLGGGGVEIKTIRGIGYRLDETP